MTNLTPHKPALRAVPMALFPTMGSLQEVIDLASSKLPMTDKNEMHSILMVYHNTLLAQLPH
jgi:hypothetical protein